MKRWIAILLAATMLLSLCACGGETASEATSEAAEASAPAASVAVEEPAQEPEVVEEPSKAIGQWSQIENDYSNLDTLTLNEDGTGSFVGALEQYDVTWTETDGIVELSFEKDGPQTLTYELEITDNWTLLKGDENLYVLAECLDTYTGMMMIDTKVKKAAEILNIGDTLSLDFLTMTIGEAGLKDEIKFSHKSGNITHSYIPASSAEGTTHLYLQGSIKNLSGTALERHNMRCGVLVNDEFFYECDISMVDSGASSSFTLEPLMELTYVIHAAVPDELLGMMNKVVWEIGFNDKFNMDDYVETAEECEYFYNICSYDASGSQETAASGEEAPAEAATAQAPAPVENAAKTITLGETVSCDDYEFTLYNVEFSYEVMPENTNGVYTSYPADSGKVYVHIDGYLKNLMQRDIRIDELFEPSAVYGSGYNYKGFVIVNDGDNSFDWVGSYVAATPLETAHVHGLIECPKEVAETSEPMVVGIEIGGVLYNYTMR